MAYSYAPSVERPMPATRTSSRHGREIESIREFNRFYTRVIGLLDRDFLGSPFSLTEVRVLLELYYRRITTATAIGQALGLDAGYLSRMLRGFERRGLLAPAQAGAD